MNLRIREARKDDLAQTVDVYLECIRADYAFKPKAYLDALDPAEELAECREWLYASGRPNKIYAAMDLLNEGSLMAGYIAVGPNIGEPYDYEGEVCGLFVRKAYRNLGLGLKLLKTGLEYLHTLGYGKVVIYNYHISEANSYYRALGGKVVRQEIQHSGGMALETDVFGWEIEELLEILSEKIGKKYSG